MRVDKSTIVLFELFLYCQKKFPNYDGSVPLDFVYRAYRDLTRLGDSSFRRHTTEWKNLSLTRLELRELTFFDKKILAEKGRYAREFKEAKEFLLDRKFLTEKELDGI